jgi:hypothetical protein
MVGASNLGSWNGHQREERLVKISKALQAKQMVHRANALSKERFNALNALNFG